MTGYSAKEARLAEIERDLESISKEYQSAQERYNTAVNKASVIGSSLRQIIKGLPSEEPESSKEMVLIAVAGAGTFIICAAIILLLDFANLSLRSQVRLERFTGLKNIATLNENNLSLTQLAEIFQYKKGNKHDEAFVHFLRKFRFEVQSSNKQLILITSIKRTPDDLTKLRGTIEKLTGVTGTKFYELERAKDNAIARFDVMYSGDADKLLEAIRSINEPGFVFDMNAGTRDRVTIRLKNQ